MKLFICFLFAGSFFSTAIFSQSYIHGKITDKESGEELIYANIVLISNGVFAAGASTDFEGNYSIPIDPGFYSAKITYTGYPDTTIKDIVVVEGKNTTRDVQLSYKIQTQNVVVRGYKVPLITPDNTYNGDWDPELIKQLDSRSPIFDAIKADTIKTSSIYGKITSAETGEELIYTNIVLNSNGVFAAGASTDFEGNYSIPIDPGTYEMKISYTGFPDRIITDIIVKKDQVLELNVELGGGVGLIPVINFSGCGRPPLIEQDNTTSGQTTTSERIRNMPTKNINDIILNTPGVSINNYY